jgi:S-adenosylmethionine-diacylglycerol 3-amino-3-carboxypropyl transferase
MTLSAPLPKSVTGTLLSAAHDMLFRRIHDSQLIYNCAWEDPLLDRALLKLDAQSKVVMITSAGCNALDYLLEGPAEIHCVDMNYRQNALLHLKQALITKGKFQDLFAFFGRGRTNHHKAIYQGVRSLLPERSAQYWDKNIQVFNPYSRRESFYYHGAAGYAAWMLQRAMVAHRPDVEMKLFKLVKAESLAEQRQLYAEVEPLIWTSLVRWIVQKPELMALLGVPRAQINLIRNSYPGGLLAYVMDKLRHTLTEIPIRSNYFWLVYLTGTYSTDCCPRYLKRSKQETLIQNMDRIRTYDTTVSDFLEKNPGSYTHFVLLDHQDWLAQHNTAALRREWELIFANAAPGAKVLLRTAADNLDFIPEDLRKRLAFMPQNYLRTVHLTDRVGTYAGVHCATIA